jgi:integrase
MATFQTKPDMRLGGIKAYAVTSVVTNGKRSRQWLYLGTFPTTRDAKSEFNRVSESLNREKVSAIHQERHESKTTPTLADAVPLYFEAVEGIKLNSSKGLKPYRIALSHTCRFLGDLKLNELTPFKIEGFIAARRKEITYKHTPVGIKTIMNEVAQLSSLCGWAVKNQILKSHPFKTPQRSLKDYFPKVEKKPKNYLNLEEQAAILKASEDSPYAQTITKVLLYLGVRQGELAGLRCGDVDLARRAITVRAEKTNDYRVLPITGELVPILERLKTHRPTFRNWYLREPKHNTYLLCDEEGRPLGEPGKHLFKNLAAKAGITRKITPHVFRHTFVSNMRAAGLSPYEIMSLTGHKNVSTLEGYGVNAPKDLLQKMERAYPTVTTLARKVDEKVDRRFILLKTPLKQGYKLAGAVGFEPTNARSKIW